MLRRLYSCSADVEKQISVTLIVDYLKVIMNRLTETKFEKEMRIGFDLMDRHIDDGVKKLDAMKAEYQNKIDARKEKFTLNIPANISKAMHDANCMMLMASLQQGQAFNNQSLAQLQSIGDPARQYLAAFGGLLNPQY